MKTFIFHTYLFENKSLSREIEVLDNTGLYELAEAIVNAYDFEFDHAFGFFSNITKRNCFDSERKYELFTDLDDIEPTGAGSVKKTKVDDVWRNAGDKMLFLFDYGDDWRFVVELKDFREKEEKAEYPRLLTKTGKSPTQY
jgi:hypothetical protein